MTRNTPHVQLDAGTVDFTPWKPAAIVGGLLVLAALGIYVFFPR